MFDTHCHLNFKRFKKNVDDVIQRAFDAGVQKIVIPGTDVKTSKKGVELSGIYDELYAAVGIHPHHAYKLVASPELRVASEVDEIEKLISHPKVVAVGEVGMDRHVYENTQYEQYAVDEKFIEIQRELLKMQMQLAKKYNKSLILHNREAKRDMLALLHDTWDDQWLGRSVFHCCEPDTELLAFAQEHQMFMGVDGDVTYVKEKQEFIRQVPLEMLVIETDSPYILPEPLLSEKKYPNEPANVKYVAEAVAMIKGRPLDTVIAVTTENGMRLFQQAHVS